MGSVLIITLLGISTVFAGPPPSNTLDLELLSKGLVGSQCLDGTQAGFYYQAPISSDGNSLWTIYLEGGGHCCTKSGCQQRANGALGSSKYWHSTMTGNSVYSTSSTENPDFYNAHHVFVPYCCGDWHTGKVTVPTNKTWGYYFDGHYIVENILNELISKYDLLNAKNILITGASAGGIGTFLNLDFIANYLNATKNGITVKGAPIAGWFFAGNTTDQINDPLMPPNDYQHYIVMNDSSNGGFGHDASVPILWDAYLQPNCVDDLNKNGKETWHCFSVHNLYPYIETPLFVLENKYDSDQITYEMAMPNTVNTETKKYVEYFGEDMRRSIENYLIDNTVGNGVFFASCYDHTSGLNVGNSGATTKINGYNSSGLVGDWFWQRNKLPHIVYDTCTSTLPCNPTCHGF